jgi:Asparagine synthase
MFFTLAVSAPDPATCAALAERACGTDSRAMPVPGPAQVIWRARDGRSAIITWGACPNTLSEMPSVSGNPHPSPAPGVSGYAAVGSAGAARSYAGTIWASEESAGTVFARTGITRVDPVFVARAGRATVLSDRATWAAAASSRLGDADALLYAGLLGPGYPLGAVTPFAGVRALAPATSCHVTGGAVTETEHGGLTGPARSGPASAARVAEALVQAVMPLRDASAPVELSLTGGKDSRLIAAALARAGVPARARTYGFPDHPDVVVAARVAHELGLVHEVAEPRTTLAAGPTGAHGVAGIAVTGGAAGTGATADGAPVVQEVDVLGRLRATVLVADGMLSAFENVGRPDPDAGTATAIAIGGHGGELLRGGYAKIIPGSAARRAAGSAELLRRLTMRRVPLLRARWRIAYLASLTPWAAAVAARPQPALDDFYLVNRAGRWSAAARQAYAIRSVMAQPYFDDQVVRAARSAPLTERLDDRLVRGAIGALCPALLDIPLAADRWKCDTAKPAAHAPAAAYPGQRARFDWRRGYGDDVAGFLRDYVLGTGSGGGLFAIVSRPAAERLLRPPHTDPVTVWALATLAALISGDWLNARAADGQTFAIPVPV